MPFKSIHGLHGISGYDCWKNMRRRCLDPNHRQYPDYGGRGITIDPAWDDFKTFYEDMGPRPEGHTIERVDNEKGYCKDNCIWATRTAQNRNKRNNRWLTYKGQTKLMSHWAEEYGLSRSQLYQRLAKGWDLEKALTTPFTPRPYRKKIPSTR